MFHSYSLAYLQVKKCTTSLIKDCQEWLTKKPVFAESAFGLRRQHFMIVSFYLTLLISCPGLIILFSSNMYNCNCYQYYFFHSYCYCCFKLNLFTVILLLQEPIRASHLYSIYCLELNLFFFYYFNYCNLENLYCRQWNSYERFKVVIEHHLVSFWIKDFEQVAVSNCFEQTRDLDLHSAGWAFKNYCFNRVLFSRSYWLILAE